MNSVQRRLFRAFVQAGGDLADQDEVERFRRYVEATFSILPPKVKAAVELTWQAEASASYVHVARRLSHDEGSIVTPTATRQRVSRGLRLLEESIRHRPWGLPAPRSGES